MGHARIFSKGEENFSGEQSENLLTDLCLSYLTIFTERPKYSEWKNTAFLLRLLLLLLLLLLLFVILSLPITVAARSKT
jgi:hypothetical protein